MNRTHWCWLLLALGFVLLGCQAPGGGPQNTDVTPTAAAPAPETVAATFHSPLDACRTPGGKLLVVYGEDEALPHLANSLVRFDADGRFEKEIDLGLHFAHSISATDRGTFWITDQKNFRILEIDEDGRVLHTIHDRRGDGANSAVELPDGTLLVSVLGIGIEQLDRDGRVLRHIFSDDSTHDATPLPEGHVLFTSVEKGALEVDALGKVVWEVTPPTVEVAKNARRLPSGNTLVANRDGLIEVDAAGAVVRKSDKIMRCYNFKMEPDGGVMLVHALRGLVFLDRELKIKRTLAYRAPQTWDEFRGQSLNAETLQRMKQLGYL